MEADDIFRYDQVVHVTPVRSKTRRGEFGLRRLAETTSGLELLPAALLVYLPLDNENDSLVVICDLLRFLGVATFFAYERIIWKIPVAQVNCSIRPRLLPTSEAVEDLPEVKTVEAEMKFLAHRGHQYLARAAIGGKPFVLVDFEGYL